jgi:hypothetical protein
MALWWSARPTACGFTAAGSNRIVTLLIDGDWHAPIDFLGPWSAPSAVRPARRPAPRLPRHVADGTGAYEARLLVDPGGDACGRARSFPLEQAIATDPTQVPVPVTGTRPGIRSAQDRIVTHALPDCGVTENVVRRTAALTRRALGHGDHAGARDAEREPRSSD